MNRVNAVLEQCRKPSGWLGRLNLKRMNSGHSNLTDWGLAHVSVGKQFTIFDVGCGGGRTVQKLAALASEEFMAWTTPKTASPSHVKRTATRSQRGAWRFSSPRLIWGARKAEDPEGLRWSRNSTQAKCTAWHKDYNPPMTPAAEKGFP